MISSVFCAVCCVKFWHGKSAQEGGGALQALSSSEFNPLHALSILTPLLEAS